MRFVFLASDDLGTEHDAQLDTEGMILRVFNEGGHNSVDVDLPRLFSVLRKRIDPSLLRKALGIDDAPPELPGTSEAGK